MAREKRRTLSELVKVRDLMPSLMVLRNFQKWTSEDKRELRVHLKRLSRVSAYIAFVVMPGGFVLVPVMAWWLNRRHVKRVAFAHSYSSAIPTQDLHSARDD
jgi:hypothetical protein